ncbi:trigger factor [bacterium]|nr:trigger factor [bacterium]
MSVNLEKNENNEVIMDITVDAQETNAAYDRACKRIAQHVNIPGFRKGKAPKKILEKHVGTAYIQREVLDSVLPGILTNVIKDNNYDTVTEPSVDYFKFEDDGSLSVKAKVELRPEFTLPEYKGLELPIDMFKQDDSAMQKELDDIKEKHSTLQTVEDRITNDKDLVNIDFEGFVDGNAIKGGAAKNYMLDLGHSNFIPGFAEQLVGKEKNSEFTIQVKFPEEYHDETIKGKDAEFKIKINEIKERIYPEINDELAKKVGKFETLDELKADIQKYLDAAEKTENEKRATVVLFDKLLASTEMNIQEPMIQREVKAMKEEINQRAMLQGQNLDDLMKNEDSEKINNEMHDEAAKRIKTALIISRIAKNENIMVESKDIDARIFEISRMYGITPEMMIQEIQKNPHLLYSLNQQIMSQKVTKFLLDNSTIISKE